jgi:hypothetical protein
MLQPGGALQTPFSVEQTSPIAQLLVDAHGTPPPAPPFPVEAPPTPPLPAEAPPAPPAPVGSSGHETLQ